MRRAAAATVLTATLTAGLLPSGSSAQEIIRFGDAGESLSERMSQARVQASARASREGRSVLVGYGIVVRAPANEIWGMYSLNKSSRPTLAELIDGRRNEDPGARVRSDSDRLVERRAAVLVQLDTDGRPVDVHLYTLDTRTDFRDDTMYWLGTASLDSSFDLLLPYMDADHTVEVRRGSVYALARHGLPDRALPVLSGLIRDASEPHKLRKAAIYGLGMLRSDAARRTLTDLIYDETL